MTGRPLGWGPTLRGGRARGGPRRRERPLGGRVARLGLAVALAFAGLALGAGYWQVVRGPELARDPSDAAVVAAARSLVRGRILDRDGNVLASTVRDAKGQPYRVYASPAISNPIGYASRLYGTSGLEHAYDAELTGEATGDPLDLLFGRFRPVDDRRMDLQTSLSLALQKQAVKLLGSDRGAVVALDPRTGDVLALASTPTFDASAIANPATSKAAFAAAMANASSPLVDRAVQGTYVPGSVMKIVTAMAGLQSGAITPATTFAQQPGAERTGLLVDGYRVRDGHHLFTGSELLDFDRAVEVSCNIWFALAGLRTGGSALDATARGLGFGAPIPFDLPTATSQLTNGGGPLPGGFADNVELANASYGQAEVLVTPLQMALVAATVANRGIEPAPRLVTGFVDRTGGVRSLSPRSLGQVVSGQVAAQITTAMVQAVQGTDGRRFTTGAQVAGVTVAGKTGTAQLGGTGEPHSWFIGFAPADHPTIAIAVIVEQGGSGATRAAPLAGAFLSAYFAGLK